MYYLRARVARWRMYKLLSVGRVGTAKTKECCWSVDELYGTTGCVYFLRRGSGQ